MYRVMIAVLLGWAASAQTVVEPEERAQAAKSLVPHEGENTLRCEVEPVKPRLGFGMRFEAGYELRVPLMQFSKGSHTWDVTVGVTPESGGTVYFSDRLELPPVLRPEMTGEVTGMFVFGEGRYRVQFAAADEAGRVCRKEWQAEGALGRSERGIQLALQPNVIGDLSGTVVGERTPTPVGSLRRVTLLVNLSKAYVPLPVMPVTPDGPVTIFRRPSGTIWRPAVFGIVSALVERFWGAEIRLVIFDLDQQRELFRRDGFTPDDMPDAAHAADDLAHWAVDYHELQNRPGRWGLIASLIDGEISRPDRPDVVLFVGPQTGSKEKMPRQYLKGEPGDAPRFYYLQYRLVRQRVNTGVPLEMVGRPPYGNPESPRLDRIASAELPDCIEWAVARMKGKTIAVHLPAEFGKAMETVEKGK